MSAPSSAIDAYVGLGSNLGDSIDLVTRAIEQIGTLPLTQLEQQSSLFRTAPIDAAGNDFINAVVKLRTGLTPTDLLLALQQIETAFGRERSHVNAPRTLDLDILLFGTQRIASPDLVVPHPRLTQRAFALIPLLQIDPFIAIAGHGPAHAFVPGIADQKISKIQR